MICRAKVCHYPCVSIELPRFPIEERGASPVSPYFEVSMSEESTKDRLSMSSFDIMSTKSKRETSRLLVNDCGCVHIDKALLLALVAKVVRQLPNWS